ncbi:hypothetical protein JCM8097_004148 [Rhodosporidiobolus ruineniae]
MAQDDSLALVVLRFFAGGVGGILTGLLLSGPLLTIPSTFTAHSLSSRSRLHLWSRLHHDTTSLTALLLPLLTASLALCALLAHSATPSTSGTACSDFSLVALVRENRKTLFTLAAVLTLALKPYSFGVLTPRIELLKAEERRLVLERFGGSGGAGGSLRAMDEGTKAALGLGRWRGGSPAGSEKGGGEGDGGEETDEEDNGESEEEGPEGKREKVDTDALIVELSRWQLGTAVLAGAAFGLVLLELVCV